MLRGTSETVDNSLWASYWVDSFHIAHNKPIANTEVWISAASTCYYLVLLIAMNLL